ncbi:MAG: hypothetical protein J6V72_15720 [Kiritimatiellae bacterium]|nr:hypothetical protein [Kiritimatiellia bacterium]
MIGGALYLELMKSRPMGKDKYFSGCVCHLGDGLYHIEFVSYWNRGGIAGRLSMREVAAAAPGLVASLRHHGDELRAYLAAEDARRAPGGLGSSPSMGQAGRTREGAGICDCNGETGSGYARGRPWRAPMAAQDVDGSTGSCDVQAAPDGGFARGSRLTARNGKGRRG